MSGRVLSTKSAGYFKIVLNNVLKEVKGIEDMLPLNNGLKIVKYK